MPIHPPIWSYLTPEEQEFHYNPQHAFPDFARHQQARAPLNARARRELAAHWDVPYGEHPLRTLDIFPAAPGAPVHLFLHGGYWRAQDKQNYSCIAGALVPLGITTVIANYELCPAATLDGVVDSALAAFAWTCRRIGDYGADPQRISVSGHSAGAHLAAEILAADWSARGVDATVLTGAVMVSGIFDPTPAIATSVNADLHLDAEIAARHNMEDHAPRVHCPTLILAGGLEPTQWIDQSFRYSHHLRRHGGDPAVTVVPGQDHFSILAQYLHPDSAILQTIRAHVGLPAS